MQVSVSSGLLSKRKPLRNALLEGFQLPILLLVLFLEGETSIAGGLPFRSHRRLNSEKKDLGINGASVDLHASMEPAHRLIVLLAFIFILCKHQYKTQSSTSPTRALDALLQDYAYQAFVRPRTGVFYDGNVPSNLTGIKISVVRLRSGSLRSRGVKSYKEFGIPVGIIVQPYVERLALVYQNLGNWSSVYYPLPGFMYLTPVRGLLAYDASNLTATNLPELAFAVLGQPILINFTDVGQVPMGLTPKCVWFNLDGLPEFEDLVSDNVCRTFRQGHFSIVVNSTQLTLAPAPAPSKALAPRLEKRHKSRVWKIVVGVVGGFVGLALLMVLALWLGRHSQDRKVAKMEQHAEVGEALHMARVENTQVPVALGTRTQPILENEYVA